MRASCRTPTIMRHKDTAAALRAKYGAAYGKQRDVQEITPAQREEIAQREQQGATERSRAVMAMRAGYTKENGR